MSRWVAIAIPLLTFPQTNDKVPTAASLVNTLPTGHLARIFKTYGEERHALAAATAITLRRDSKRFETTGVDYCICCNKHSHRAARARVL